MKGKKLKIAMVTNNYTPYNGGVVSSINSFAEELKKQGHKVFIITLDFLGKKHNDPDNVVRIPSIMKFIYKKNHMAVVLRSTKKLEKIIKKINPDIIHSHHPFYLGSSAEKVAKKLDIPIIFTYHSTYERYAHYIPVPQWITRPIIKKTVLSFCKKVDGIIVPCNEIKQYLIKNEIKTNITRIPSGILPIFINNKHENKRDNKSTFNMLTVSRFAKEKNIPLLLDVLDKLYFDGSQEIKYTLTLAGYGAEFENIQQYAYQKLCLPKENVRFLHKPNKQHISKLYSQSDLFLFSSTSDTQGLVLAEAMASGCPVVSIDGAGQRDIVKNNYNGFLVDSAKEMAEKITFVAQNTSIHEKLKNGAFETGTQYHPQKMTLLMATLFQKQAKKF